MSELLAGYYHLFVLWMKYCLEFSLVGLPDYSIFVYGTIYFVAKLIKMIGNQGGDYQAVFLTALNKHFHQRTSTGGKRTPVGDCVAYFGGFTLVMILYAAVYNLQTV